MTTMKEEGRVELEPGVTRYLSKMRAAFCEIENNLFPIVEMPIESQVCKYCGHLVQFADMRGFAIHWEQTDEAGSISSPRQICGFLEQAASAALEEKSIVTCAMVRDKAVEALSQVSDTELLWGCQQFLQRDPAEVIA